MYGCRLHLKKNASFVLARNFFKRIGYHNNMVDFVIVALAFSSVHPEESLAVKCKTLPGLLAPGAEE